LNYNIDYKIILLCFKNKKQSLQLEIMYTIFRIQSAMRNMKMQSAWLRCKYKCSLLSGLRHIGLFVEFTVKTLVLFGLRCHFSTIFMYPKSAFHALYHAPHRYLLAYFTKPIILPLNFSGLKCSRCSCTIVGLRNFCL
jgi:hypothetical protein